MFYFYYIIGLFGVKLMFVVEGGGDFDGVFVYSSKELLVIIIENRYFFMLGIVLRYGELMIRR